MAFHSSILAWEIPWTEEPGRLQSIGSQRLGAATVFLNTPHQGTFSVSRSHTFCPHFLKIHRALSETLLSQNFDLEECRRPKPDIE